MFINIGIDEVNDIHRLTSRIIRTGIEKNITIATAESCTGGIISSLLTSISGSSKVFLGGVVSYSNTLKEEFLDVPLKMLEAYGAVSKEVAMEMAYGISKKTGSDYSVAVTGIAGPTGGTREKPVGLVYIALYSKKDLEMVNKFNFQGDRERIRFDTTREALILLDEHLSLRPSL